MPPTSRSHYNPQRHNASQLSQPQALRPVRKSARFGLPKDGVFDTALLQFWGRKHPKKTNEVFLGCGCVRGYTWGGSGQLCVWAEGYGGGGVLLPQLQLQLPLLLVTGDKHSGHYLYLDGRHLPKVQGAGAGAVIPLDTVTHIASTAMHLHLHATSATGGSGLNNCSGVREGTGVGVGAG
ncbi:hypothetical protein B484DRAFT_426075, partial [Ochromonadaceae sp. CCMP2298]